MKFPFPKWNQVTPVKVYKTELSEDGEPVEEVIFDGLAFYDERQRQVLDAQRRLALLSGKVIIEGDIAPGEFIEGFVQVDNVKKAIFEVIRPRNPDGSVFSTELDLM